MTPHISPADVALVWAYAATRQTSPASPAVRRAAKRLAKAVGPPEPDDDEPATETPLPRRGPGRPRTSQPRVSPIEMHVYRDPRSSDLWEADGC